MIRVHDTAITVGRYLSEHRHHLAALLILVGADTAEARRLLTPAELPLRDQAVILDLLGTDHSQVSRLDGYRYIGRPDLAAVVGIPRRELAAGLDVVDEHFCFQREGGWVCQPWGAHVYAELPPACGDHRIERPDRPLRFSPHAEFSVQQIRGVITVLCTSAELYTEIWSQGGKPESVRWMDGRIEVRVNRPETDDWGWMVAIEQTCRQRACEYSLADIFGWVV